MDRRDQGLGAQIASAGGGRPSAARVAAAIVALTAWTGLILQFDASLITTGTAGAALWLMLRFFTIIANLFVAILFARLALGRPSRPGVIGAALLAILLVGIVYHLLLAGRVLLAGPAWWADLAMHSLTPLLVPLYWLGFVPKGALRAVDPLRWAALPLAYFGYAIGRGESDGKYPYFFLDIGKIGVGAVLGWAVAIAIGFLVGGLLLVWLDRGLARFAARR